MSDGGGSREEITARTGVRDEIAPSAPSVSSSRPSQPVTAVDGATTMSGPSPDGRSKMRSVGSQSSGPTRCVSRGQSGRQTSNAGRVAISRAAGAGP
ncbi:Uncharacterised protein [Mycobacteroides abscessus subsp. abscessus]|nr:Uncharacterised protein [Mycobacteroides abscessus subsp. abscessus]